MKSTGSRGAKRLLGSAPRSGCSNPRERPYSGRRTDVLLPYFQRVWALFEIGTNAAFQWYVMRSWHVRLIGGLTVFCGALVWNGCTGHILDGDAPEIVREGNGSRAMSGSVIAGTAPGNSTASNGSTAPNGSGANPGAMNPPSNPPSTDPPGMNPPPNNPPPNPPPNDPPPPNPPPNPPPPSDVCGNAEEREVVRIANVERQRQGLPAYECDAALQRAARAHSDDQCRTGRLSHTGSDGSSFSERARAQGAVFCAGGENVAGGQRTAQDAMNSWMNSSGHRRNILSSQYRRIGVGYVSCGGRPYWTQVFADNGSCR